MKILKDELDEINGYVDDFNVVSFFYSFCRLRRCDLCRQIQFRITSNGIAKNCLYYDNKDVNIFDGGDISSNLKRFLNNSLDYYYDSTLLVDEKEKVKKYGKRNTGIYSQ